MKKLFISQPMNGKTDEEILATRERIIKLVEEKLGEQVKLIDSFFQDVPHEAKPLWYLGRSIELLSTADIVCFGHGWERARGYKIEMACAVDYGIPILLEDNLNALSLSIKEFAKNITNRDYDYKMFAKDEIKFAKDHGFVIVYSNSYGHVQFNGAICESINFFFDGEVYFDRNGFTKFHSTENMIEVCWYNKNERDVNGCVIPWTYKTNIPHETFMIYKAGEPYCRGIVFSVSDIK